MFWIGKNLLVAYVWAVNTTVYVNVLIMYAVMAACFCIIKLPLHIICSVTAVINVTH